MKCYLNATKEDFIEIKNNRKVRCDPRVTAIILLEKSNLKDTQIYVSFDSHCLYDTDKHVYIEYNKHDFLLIVTEVLTIANYLPITSARYVRLVIEEMGTVTTHSFSGVPQIDPNILVFDNGIFNLETKKIEPHNPKYLVFSHLPYEYTQSTSMPHFEEFLNHFCVDYEDRRMFVRCFLYTVLYGTESLQLFFHFFGVGKTGKSTLANLAQCLVGKDSCVSTSLKRLSSDQFEISNLVNKKMILILESDSWVDDMSILKSISGGDTIPGRKKHVQGSFEVNVEGVLAIFNNSKFNTRDESGAIQRRLKQFRADNRVSEEKDLLRYTSRKGWIGLLVPEIPAILNWIVGLDSIEVKQCLSNIEKSMPSFAKEIDDTKMMLNPMAAWIRDEIIIGNGLYIGVQNPSTTRNDLEARQRKTLYPAYRSWCIRNGPTPKGKMNFTSSIEGALSAAGIPSSIRRKEWGQFVEGVNFNSKVFLLDYQQGSSAWSDDKEVISDNGLPTYNPSIKRCAPCIGPNLFDDYRSILSNSPLKELLNAVCKEQMTDDLIPQLVDDYLTTTRLRDKDFISSVTNQIGKGVLTVRKYGGIPYTWGPCGVSSRLIPNKYGETINFTKKVVRNKAYEIMGFEAKKLGYTVVDIDIVSCYLGILIGLCPAELHSIRMIVENSNIWVEIQKEFEKQGQGAKYDKSAVKVCVYSSYFLGGATAMRNGIHDNIRKATGLKPKDYKNTAYYEEANNIAVEVIRFMENSEIIASLKATSLNMKEQYVGHSMTGPDGSTWKVTEENWRKVYPQYLISFEISLLGRSTLNVIKKYPRVEMIGHYHDGAVLAIPTEDFEEVMSFHKAEIANIGTQLGLQFTQKIEIQKTY